MGFSEEVVIFGFPLSIPVLHHLSLEDYFGASGWSISDTVTSNTFFSFCSRTVLVSSNREVVRNLQTRGEGDVNVGPTFCHRYRHSQGSCPNNVYHFCLSTCSNYKLKGYDHLCGHKMQTLCFFSGGADLNNIFH